MRILFALFTLIAFPFLEGIELKTPEEVFTSIYEKNLDWPGSTIENTVEYRAFLRKFMIDYEIKSVVDFGCGNWSFSHAIDWSGIDYYGYDVVKKFIDENEQYADGNIHFIYANALEVDLPKADLMICKDVLQHLNEDQVFKFLERTRNFRYILVVNDPYFSNIGTNSQISTGQYRPLDITSPPFCFNANLVYQYEIDHRPKHIYLIDNSALVKQNEEIKQVKKNGEIKRMKKMNPSKFGV